MRPCSTPGISANGIFRPAPARLPLTVPDLPGGFRLHPAFGADAGAGGTVPALQELPDAGIALLDPVVGEGRDGPRQDDRRQGPHHVTSTQVFMPDAWWPSVWQCRSHLPGLSNTQSMSRLACLSTRVVSR